LAIKRSIPAFNAHCFVSLSELADIPFDKYMKFRIKFWISVKVLEICYIIISRSINDAKN
jgi:uncharacterized ion transporter superfamily protein YfcC